MKTFEDFKDEYTQIDLKEPNGNWDEFVAFSNAEEIAKAIDIISERYANYKAEMAHDELKSEIIGLLPFHGGDVLPHVINNIPNPYKNARHN